MAYSGKRSQGVQLDDKDLGLDNYQTPSGGYVPSNPDRTKHMGSDGTRAQVGGCRALLHRKQRGARSSVG